MEIKNLESHLAERRKSIINMHHDIASYLVSSQVGSDFLEKSTKRILEEACTTLGFSQGEVYLLLDEQNNIPKVGEVEKRWSKIKPIVGIGLEEGENYDERDVRLREDVTNPKRRNSFFYVINNNILQLYRNKEYIKVLEKKRILREGFWEEYFEKPTTKDTRNILIPITRNISSGYEVPGFANFSVPNYEIREDEPVSDLIVDVAKEAVDSVTDYLVSFGLLDELQKSIKERERLASIAATGTIAGEIAHDLGNMGTIIHQNIDLALKNLKRGKYNESERKLEAGLDATRKLTSLSHQFKNIAPISTKCEYADIHKSLDALLEVEESSFKHQELEVRIIKEFDFSIKEIYHNIGELSRVYVNLLANSQRAIIEKKEQMKSRGLYYRPEIRVTTKNLDDRMQITFYDNGTGIKKEDLDKVFDVSYTTKPQSESVGGYGLSSAYRIINEHKGKIELRSKVGEYTEVVLILPTG